VDEEQKQIGTSLLSIEANVLIAGIECFAALWVLLATYQDSWVPPPFGSGWSTAENAVYATVALLAIMLVGLALEGVAGLIEDKLVSWLCYRDTKHESKFSDCNSTSDAYKDFSRRRLRILVARNTACCLLLLTIGLVVVFIAKCDIVAASLVLLAGFLITALFGYLWFDARRGLKNQFISASNKR
jgi:hypothetical protein